MSMLRVRKTVRVFVGKGDTSIVNLRKDDRLRKGKWKNCIEYTKRLQVTEAEVERL